jgi:hypothetical protein
MTEPNETSYSRRFAPMSRLRVAVPIAIAAVVIAAGAIGLAAKATTSPTIPGSDAALAAAANPVTGSGQAMPLDGRGPGMDGFGGVTITAINGSSLSLRTDDGWTRTIAVTSSTTITRAGATIGVSDLKVGDSIAFRQTRQSDGTYAVNSITVVLPTVAGTVTSVTGNTLTVTTRDGTAWTITLTSSTSYTLDRAAGQKSDLATGRFVVVEGAGAASGNTLTASAVRISSGTQGPDGRPGFDLGHGFGHGSRSWGGGPAAPSAAPSGSTSNG